MTTRTSKLGAVAHRRNLPVSGEPCTWEWVRSKPYIRAEAWPARPAGGGGTALPSLTTLPSTTLLPSDTGTPPAQNVTRTGTATGRGVAELTAITTSTPDTVTITYTNDATTNFPSPSRGFYVYSETHYNADNTGYDPLLANRLNTARTGVDAQTLVYRYFVMEKWRTTDTISPEYLNLIRTDLATVRANGFKIIPRFTYSIVDDQVAPYNADCPLPRMLGHIGQLMPVLNEYADIVELLQAGFIGVWGEWYYSDNFGREPLTSQNWADRTTVLNAILDALDPKIPVAVRYVGIKEHIYGSTPTDPRADRVTFHNDAFLSTQEDMGTYETYSDMSLSATKAYLESQVAFPLPVGGESNKSNPPHSEWASANTELTRYRYTYLNEEYHPAVLSSWGSNIDIAKRRLGYRLRLTSGQYTQTAAAGGDVTVTLTIVNDGYQAPWYNRPVQILFVNGATTIARSATPVNPQRWGPGSRTITFTVKAPTTPGQWGMHLRLPDPTVALRSNPAYSIRLANTGVWDATTGRNSLGHTLTVTGSSPTTAPPPILTHLPYSTATGLGGAEGSTDMAVLETRVARGDVTGVAWYSGAGNSLNHSAWWDDLYFRFPGALHTLAMPRVENRANLVNWASNMPAAWRKRAEMAPFQEPEDNIEDGNLDPAYYRQWCRNAVEDLSPWPNMHVVHELQGYWLLGSKARYDIVKSCLVPETYGIGWSQIVPTGHTSNVGDSYAVAYERFHNDWAPEKEMRIASIAYGVPDNPTDAQRRARADNLEIAVNRAIDVGAKGIGVYELRFQWSDGLWYDFRNDQYSTPVMVAARARLAAL